MIITLLIISIALFVFGCKFGSTMEWEDHAGWIAPIVVGGAGTVIFLIMSSLYFIEIVKVEQTIDNRIELYESYNEDIKAQVDAVAIQYIDYEGEIYENFSTQDILLIVPELDANTVVMEQIALYETNQLKLLNLQEKKIDLSFNKFLLYWGH